MPKRYTPILAVTALLALVALFGFSVPSAEPDVPLRILMDNTGGTVVFDHSAHAAYGVHCTDCHHAGKTQATEIPCGACHPADFDEAYVARHRFQFQGKVACFACHHLEFDEPIFDHDMHTDIASDCTDCHHGVAIEQEPASCGTCHEQAGPTDPAGKDIPNLRDAVHPRCTPCHQDLFDQGLAGCASCHSHKDELRRDLDSPLRCHRCHDTPQSELVPTRKQAFHGQCVGCHERRRKGPYRNQPEVKDCGRCHLP